MCMYYCTVLYMYHIDHKVLNHYIDFFHTRIFTSFSTSSFASVETYDLSYMRVIF